MVEKFADHLTQRSWKSHRKSKRGLPTRLATCRAPPKPGGQRPQTGTGLAKSNLHDRERARRHHPAVVTSARKETGIQQMQQQTEKLAGAANRHPDTQS
jgi:hypothetical protein